MIQLSHPLASHDPVKLGENQGVAWMEREKEHPKNLGLLVTDDDDVPLMKMNDDDL